LRRTSPSFGEFIEDSHRAIVVNLFVVVSKPPIGFKAKAECGVQPQKYIWYFTAFFSQLTSEGILSQYK
jgi:hypothetical protein